MRSRGTCLTARVCSYPPLSHQACARQRCIYHPLPPSLRRRGPHPHLQALADGRIRLLVGHPASDPLCPRLLRGCAALLSPLSAALAPACAAGTALYDDPPAVMPRLVAGGRLGVDGSGQAGASGVAHGSLLLTAGNRGVAVVEAEVLTNKWVSQALHSTAP